MGHRREGKRPEQTGRADGRNAGPPVLQLVLKADTRGTLEAVEKAVDREAEAGLAIEVIERGVGDVSKNDLAMSTTGSRLVLGFDVGVLPRMDEYAKEHGVEVRLYDLVDRLAKDAAATARALSPPPAEERILGQGRVVALFKSTRHGVILGCEVLEGRLAVGMPFRIIDPAGPVYEGRIESLHVEDEAVQQAKPGQKVGLKVTDFKQGRVGDLVECFEAARTVARPWAPRPGVHRI